MSADYGTVLQDRIKDRRRKVDALRNELNTISAPVRPTDPTRGEQAAYDAEAREYRESRSRLQSQIDAAENDIEAAESQIGAEAARARSEKQREQASARSQAGTAARAATTAARQGETGARADERLELSTESRAEASAKAGAADVQRGREARRAGEFAWGPDGIPYGIYDDDGKLRLLDQKEQTRVISMIKAGQITRTKQTTGEAAYPGQTPEPVSTEETATLPEGLGVAGFGSGGAGGGGGSGGSGRTRFPEEAALDALQVEETGLDIQKKRRDLLGPATVALQNHISLIDQVEKMVAQGQLKPEEATTYVSTSERNYQAALRGSTVSDEQERMRADRRSKNTLGSTILNSRMQTGSSLAAALTSSAFGSDVMMPAGKSSLGYSPSMLALEMTKELGGGPEVSEFAKKMLMAEEEPWL